MVVGEPDWCARVWKRLRGKGREVVQVVPRRKTDFCRVCGGDEEHRLIVNLGGFSEPWKAWACQGCNVVTHEAG